jgi:hypothetical protein
VPAAKTVVTRYFSIDADHDISGDAAAFSLDQVTWAPGTYVPAPTPRMLAAKPVVPVGLTRYWWSLLVGPGNTLVPDLGNSVVYGKLPDTPQQLYYSWPINTAF